MSNVQPKLACCNAIAEPWIALEPVRIGRIPSGLGTPDLYVTGDLGTKRIRIDVYHPIEGCGGPFTEAILWHNFVVIGCCQHLYLAPVDRGSVSAINLDSYFGRLYPNEDFLLVASASRLLKIIPNGELVWTSPEIGIDGVQVNRIDNGVIYGEGEWDPPGGWKPFSLRITSGDLVPDLTDNPSPSTIL